MHQLYTRESLVDLANGDTDSAILTQRAAREIVAELERQSDNLDRAFNLIAVLSILVIVGCILVIAVGWSVLFFGTVMIGTAVATIHTIFKLTQHP